MSLGEAVGHQAQLHAALFERSQKIERAGEERVVFRAIGVVAIGAVLRHLGIADPDTLERGLPHARANARELNLQIVGRKAVPKALRFGNVGGLESQRIDPVLGGNFPRDFLGGALIGVGIVMQSVVEIEEHEIDAAQRAASLLGRQEAHAGDLALPIDADEKIELRAVGKRYEVDGVANVTLRPSTLLLERYGCAKVSNAAL